MNYLLLESDLKAKGITIYGAAKEIGVSYQGLLRNFGSF